MYKSSSNHSKRMDHDYDLEYDYDDFRTRGNKLILKNITHKNFMSRSKTIDNTEIDEHEELNN